MGYFENVFRALNKAKIRYLVVGGVAVNIYGHSRFTGDIDILLLLEKPNLEKMDKVMKELRYKERLPVAVEDLQDHKQVKKWLKEKGMTAFAFFPPVENPLMIDILVEESLKFEKAEKNKVVKKFDGISIPVISIEDLIRMKKKANRPKDLEDLAALKLLKDL